MFLWGIIRGSDSVIRKVNCELIRVLIDALEQVELKVIISMNKMKISYKS